MRASRLTAPKPTDCTIDLGDGDVINIRFDRNKITPAWVDKGRSDMSMTDALLDVIDEWDLVNDDDSPHELNRENLGALSYGTQSELLSRIIESSVPSRAEGNASSAPTSTPPSGSTEPPVTPPNGTVTSPLPALSAAASQT